jgi:hypothetical protein
MDRFGTQLMPEAVAEAIVGIARGEAGLSGAAFGVTGRGVEALSKEGN